VTQLALAPAGDLLAAGYADGTVRIWSLDTNDCAVTFSGHKVRTTGCYPSSIRQAWLTCEAR
jgi:U3 small nucleolar RNA-associated protein 12